MDLTNLEGGVGVGPVMSADTDLAVGSLVSCYWKRRITLYPGVVASVNVVPGNDCTYDIDYIDGDKEKSVSNHC